MRWTALPLLVAATGCNWVFGLQQTRGIDAPPPPPDIPDALVVRMVFERQVGTTDTSGTAIQGAPVAIDPPPTIQTGPMPGALQPADYDATMRSFVVPSNLPGNPWRLVVTSDFDPVPTEIQWTANSAHLVLPWLARPGDAPPPAGSGWDFQAQGTGIVIANPRVMTSGAFTETNAQADLAGNAEVTFHYAQHAKPILGPLGTPTVAQGDWALLYDYRIITNSPTQKIDGSIGHAWTQADLTAGALTTVKPAWVTTTAGVSGINWATPINQPRFGGVSSLGGTCCSFHLEYGILPSPYIAPFVPSPDGVDTTSLIQLYVEDNTTSAPISISVNDPPTTQVKLPRMLLAAYQAPRTSNGVTVTNTIQTLGTAKTLTFAAPLAESVTLGGMTLMTGSLDNQQIPASASTITLKWTAEASTANLTLGADDWVVTLYEVASSAMTPIRRYQVLSPRVDVDGGLLMTGHRYVFGITSRSGFPNAPQGDYSTVTLPFSETTTFPLMFVVM
ncbi:MAG: hypothetical protein ACM31C_02925 [Acidobacteriota bacterium]